MEISIKDLAFAQLCPFDGLRFLDLHHHLALGENLVRRVDDLCTRFDILLVGRIDTAAGLSLDPDLIALDDQLLRTLRRQADAIFVVLDFLGATDTH